MKGCGGFNYPNGFLKKLDCLQKRGYEATSDLYLLLNDT
jgi:hypothetical protein